MNLTRIEAELLVQILAGGDTPSDGDTIVRGLDGWRFDNVLGLSSASWVAIDADGAVGDGSTDDTTELQSVLDRAKFVLIPAKTFKITSKLKFYAGQVVIGAGQTSVIKGALGTALISSDDTSAVRNSIIAANFKIDNTSKATAGGIGFDGTNINELLLINILCTNVATGFKLTGDSTLVNCVGFDCTTHYDCDDGHLRFIGPRAENTPTSGTGFDVAAGVDSCIIVSPELTGLTTDYVNAGSIVVINKDNIRLWSDEPFIDLQSSDASGKRWKWVSGGGGSHTAGDAVLQQETDGRQPIRVKDDAGDEALVIDGDDVILNADLDHRGDEWRLGNKGSLGVSPAGWSGITNVTPDRAYDADATSVAELADVLGTLIADLRTRGVLDD